MYLIFFFLKDKHLFHFLVGLKAHVIKLQTRANGQNRIFMTHIFNTENGKIFTDKNCKILKTEKEQMWKYIGSTYQYLISILGIKCERIQ